MAKDFNFTVEEMRARLEPYAGKILLCEARGGYEKTRDEKTKLVGCANCGMTLFVHVAFKEGVTDAELNAAVKKTAKRLADGEIVTPLEIRLSKDEDTNPPSN